MKIINCLEELYFKILHTIHIKKFNIINLEAFQKKSVLDKIYFNKIDGVIVKNFLSEDEIRNFFKNINIYGNELSQKNVISWGYSLGDLLYVSDLNSETYYENAQVLKMEINHLFGFDFSDRLIKTLENLTEKKIEIAKTKDGKEFVSNTIRFMEPNMGGAIEHVHLANINDEIKNITILKEIIDLSGQISFFVLLQACEKGGKLKLFDLLYRNMPEKLNKLLHSNPKVLRYIRNRKTQTIEMQIGDLILFDGGNIWHRVTPVLGDKTRITIGGFANYSKDKESFLIWS